MTLTIKETVELGDILLELSTAELEFAEGECSLGKLLGARQAVFKFAEQLIVERNKIDDQEND